MISNLIYMEIAPLPNPYWGERRLVIDFTIAFPNGILNEFSVDLDMSGRLNKRKSPLFF